ncbi:hypothetical protein P885DRAFT_44821 [Corynascus similis CBS 632.67]
MNPRTPSSPQSRGNATPCRPDWQPGMVAFLHKKEECSPEDVQELIHLRAVPFGAFGHPVIVLKRLSPKSTHVLITTVSAYSTGENNKNPCPPWKQRVHRYKRPEDFRSFLGSERVSDKYPALLLDPGKQFPKPNASWVYVQNVFVVPVNVLGVFARAPMPPGTILTMCPDSLDNLLCHMADKCKVWAHRQALLDALEPAKSGSSCPVVSVSAPLATDPLFSAAPAPTIHRPNSSTTISIWNSSLSFASVLRSSRSPPQQIQPAGPTVLWRQRQTQLPAARKPKEKPWEEKKNWRE